MYSRLQRLSVEKELPFWSGSTELMEKTLEMQPFLSNCAILPCEAKFLETEEWNPAAFIHPNHLFIPLTPEASGYRLSLLIDGLD